MAETANNLRKHTLTLAYAFEDRDLPDEFYCIAARIIDVLTEVPISIRDADQILDLCKASIQYSTLSPTRTTDHKMSWF